MDEAGALLGHHYFLDGEVVSGDARGRTLGFPTANLATANELLPPHGVYATVLRVRGTWWPAVTNVGVRPTVGAGLTPTVETHVLDGTHELYGTHVRLAFVDRLRPERRFPDLSALTAQIAVDCEAARQRFRQLSL